MAAPEAKARDKFAQLVSFLLDEFELRESEVEMDKKLDLEKVERALKQAGWIAVHGPSEARDGRFTAVEATKKPPYKHGGIVTRKGK